MFGANNLDKISKLGQKGKSSKLLPYTKSKNAEERAAAASALSGAKDDDSYNALIVLLRDAEPSVCINAANSLKIIGRISAVEHLRNVASKASNAEIVEACNNAAGSLASGSKHI